MLLLLRKRVPRTIVAACGEALSTGFWGMIDQQFLADHAIWLIVAGCAGLVATWFADQIIEFVRWRKGTKAISSPIIISELLYAESRQVADNHGAEIPGLEAVTLYLQVSNGRPDGVTLKDLRGTLRTSFDIFPLPIRGGATDLRDGELVLVKLGTVVAEPHPGTGFAPSRAEPFKPDAGSTGIAYSLSKHRKLFVADNHKMGVGNDVAFHVTVSADNTPAKTVRLVADLNQDHAYRWLRFEERKEGNE